MLLATQVSRTIVEKINKVEAVTERDIDLLIPEELNVSDTLVRQIWKKQKQN